ncbi:hypothetical protein FPV67DRAFT_1547375 [Lyophyllum atratum]|nr:hypothetical protein FPV67DRAFT_1547375 [Lyophyllum atratum]
MLVILAQKLGYWNVFRAWASILERVETRYVCDCLPAGSVPLSNVDQRSRKVYLLSTTMPRIVRPSFSDRSLRRLSSGPSHPPTTQDVSQSLELSNELLDARTQGSVANDEFVASAIGETGMVSSRAGDLALLEGALGRIPRDNALDLVIAASLHRVLPGALELRLEKLNKTHDEIQRTTTLTDNRSYISGDDIQLDGSQDPTAAPDDLPRPSSPLHHRTTSRTLRPRPRATETSKMNTSAREKRGPRTKSRNTRPKKAQTLERLAKPLTTFQYKQPLTHPTWQEWENDRKKYGVRYRAGEEGKIGDVDWVSVEAYRPADDSVVGYILIPARYYPMWRHLLWGAFWHETMWEIWEEEATKIKNKRTKKTKTDDIRTVWYHCFHCLIVQELLGIDIGAYSNGSRDRTLRLFTEFGIPDYRAWMFDPIDGLHKNDRVYLTLDPTSPKNVEMFERGSLDPFLTNPPLDDDWLGGEVPFPNPRAEFVALCLKHGPYDPVEPIPLRPEEGLEHLHGV